MCTLCTLRQLLMSELWARVITTLQHEGDRTVITDAETGCSLKASELLAEVSWASYEADGTGSASDGAAF